MKPTLTLLASLPFSTAAGLYSSYRFSPLEHLGGVAPYFESLDPSTSPDPPQGCTPVQAAYLVRHAAIFANDFDYETYIEPFLSKLKNHTSIKWSTIPPLSFLSKWEPPLSDAEAELLTRSGKLMASQLGVQLSFRYPKLRTPRRVWASSAERTVESAKSLIRGLEMDDDETRLVSVYESEEGGADNLTPYKACPNYSAARGSDQSAVFVKKFTAPIFKRLNNATDGKFNFTSNDVYGMMQLCGYESVIRGSSPFCDLDLFTADDWLAWEYSSDIMYHYNVGYGSDVSGPIGLPWLNATANLLLAKNETAGGKAADREDLYVSFTHRELPPTVLVAMGLFNNSDFSASSDVNATMPLDRINYRRAWKSSHILPFLANIGVERLACKGSFGYQDGDYFRVLVNGAPQGLPGCVDGPGTSCSREGFGRYVRERGDMFKGFGESCGVDYKNSTDVLTIYEGRKEGNGTLVGRRGL